MVEWTREGNNADRFKQHIKLTSLPGCRKIPPGLFLGETGRQQLGLAQLPQSPKARVDAIGCGEQYIGIQEDEVHS